MEMGWKPNVEVSPPCPRCGSSNTKFCYYNNYSLTQPRYFCKACRRYWTKGGSLRNVPVGGGCRKTRRHKSTRPASTSTNQRVESSSISVPHEPSTTGNIDIAAVYANFLNLAPPRTNQAETASHLHEGTINVPSIEFSDIHLSSNIMPPEIDGFFQCEQFPAMVPLYGHGGGNSMFPVGFEASGNSLMSMNIPMENDLLPPLPGEEGLPPWPNSVDGVLQNQISDQEIQPSEGNANGNMGMFNGLNLEAIFRT